MDAGETRARPGSWLLPLLISSFAAGFFVAVAAGGAVLAPWQDGCEVAVGRLGKDMDRRWESVLDALVTAQRGSEAEADRVVALCRMLMGVEGAADGCESLREAGLVKERGAR